MLNLNGWNEVLGDEFKKDYYLRLRRFLKSQYFSAKVYPQMGCIFDAFKYTSFEGVKVVILGQDPYHQEGQAHGLAFSVPSKIKAPPSLLNIFKEIESDLGVCMNDPCLIPWAKQGVLLLNTVLTVRKGEPLSHRNVGWEMFTDKVIELLSQRTRPVIFLLWGRASREKEALIDKGKHYVLTAAHPSPLSAHNGFFGSRHFSKSNEILKKLGVDIINWGN